MTILKAAKEDEIRQIIKQKNSFKNLKSADKEECEIICNNFDEGKIIEDNNTLERYAIIRREDNKIVYVSLDDNTYHVHDFSKTLDFNFSIIEDIDENKFQSISKVYSLKHL